jgi:hypothetical protein
MMIFKIGTTYREKSEELGLQTLVERRDMQDMALVHKFLTEKSGTDMFRQIAANGNQTSCRRPWTQCPICCKDGY